MKKENAPWRGVLADVLIVGGAALIVGGAAVLHGAAIATLVAGVFCMGFGLITALGGGDDA